MLLLRLHVLEQLEEGLQLLLMKYEKLAEQTEASAKDIAKLIGETQAETEDAVVSMQKGSKEVETGISLVQSSGDFFEKNLQISAICYRSSKKLFRVIRVIFLQNSQNIVQVVNELSHIANTYANSSSNVEESMKEQEISVQDIAELATSLSWLSQELQELIGEFKSE